MSILIKDMKMPEACDDCPFHVYHSHYKYVCKATPMFYPMNLANSKGIRKDWCPLLEVTERKTGRWIKLDAHAHIADHKCTACGQECYVPTCMGEPMYTYCPNCGAKMER